MKQKNRKPLLTSGSKEKNLPLRSSRTDLAAVLYKYPKKYCYMEKIFFLNASDARSFSMMDFS